LKGGPRWRCATVRKKRKHLTFSPKIWKERKGGRKSGAEEGGKGRRGKASIVFHSVDGIKGKRGKDQGLLDSTE